MGAPILPFGFPQRPSTMIFGNGILPAPFASRRRTMPGGPMMPRLPQNPYPQIARTLVRNLVPTVRQPARLSSKMPPAFWGE